MLTGQLCFPGVSEVSWLLLPWMCLWQKLSPQHSNASLGQLKDFLSESWTSACAPKLQLAGQTLVKHVLTQSEQELVLEHFWQVGGVVCTPTVCDTFSSVSWFFLLQALCVVRAEQSSVRWTLAEHRRWGYKTLSDSTFSPAVWQLLKNWLWSDGPGVSLVHADRTGIVYPARTAVDGISGSPPAGFMLYYTVLM